MLVVQQPEAAFIPCSIHGIDPIPWLIESKATVYDPSCQVAIMAYTPSTTEFY